MAKRESLDKENLLLNESVDLSPEPSGAAVKIAWLSGKAFGVIKFILGVLTLPLVYAVSVSFLNELGLLNRVQQGYLWGGAISFLLVYLFVWEPAALYTRGHKIVEVIFAFFRPLVKVAPNLLPIYAIVLMAVYGILSWFAQDDRMIKGVMFLLGFSVALHLIFSAKSIRSKKGDFLKGNYIFGFSLIYIINLSLLAFFLSTMFDKYSFVNFCNVANQEAVRIFSAVFRQLFVPA